MPRYQVLQSWCQVGSGSPEPPREVDDTFVCEFLRIMLAAVFGVGETPVKIAYLVFAYQNPQLLKRTIDRLSFENCTFFIHIDKKYDIDAFSPIRAANVVFSDRRIPVYWAEYSGVQAILLLLRQAMNDPQHYDYFILLSGSEYPLRSCRYIRRFLGRESGGGIHKYSEDARTW